MGAQVYEIQLGRGLDRAAGHLAANPEAMRDLRNVYVRDGKLEARQDAEQTATIVGDTIVGVSQFATEQAGVLVGYTDASRKLDVHLVDGFGGGPPLGVGEWGTLPAGAKTPPRILGAEAGNRVFLAHDEVQLSRRMPTLLYQPFAPNELEVLRQDLGGEVDVKFRGVTTHLEYIVGWGFGHADDQDRPEVVRISVPGLFDPETNELTFRSGHFWMVGTRGDPIIRCVPLGLDEPMLLALKSAETHLLYGYDSRTFGSQRIDSRFGAASSRLVATYGGAVFVWSLEGPRVFQRPGASEDLAIPLNLRAPPPASLVSSGAIEDGWAEYVPERRAIRFVFGELKYVLHLWDPSRPEWSYEEGEDEFCGGIIFGGGTPIFGPPVGAPSLESVTDITTTGATLNIEHTNAEGNEVLEVWLRPSGGQWTRLAPQLVELPGPQPVHATDLASGVSYDVASRYRRGPHFTPGYGGDDPSQWPSYVPNAFTTRLGAPEITAAVWERTSASSERILLTVSPVYNDVDLELLYDGVVIATASAPHSGPVTIPHVDPAGEQLHTYTARHRTAEQVGDESEPVSRWSGPDAPTLTGITPQGVCAYTVRWVSASGSLYTEIEDDYQSLSFVLRQTADPGQDAIAVVHGHPMDCAQSGGEMTRVSVRIRHRQDSFGVSDYSQYAVDDTSLELCDACSFNGGL